SGHLQVAPPAPNLAFHPPKLLLRRQILLQRRAVHFLFPPRNHHRCHAVPNHVPRRPAHAHKPVDPQYQRHPCHRNRRNHHQRSHQRNKRSPLHATSALRGQNSHRQNRKLLHQGQVRARGLSHKPRRQRHVH